MAEKKQRAAPSQSVWDSWHETRAAASRSRKAILRHRAPPLAVTRAGSRLPRGAPPGAVEIDDPRFDLKAADWSVGVCLTRRPEKPQFKLRDTAKGTFQNGWKWQPVAILGRGRSGGMDTAARSRSSRGAPPGGQKAPGPGGRTNHRHGFESAPFIYRAGKTVRLQHFENLGSSIQTPAREPRRVMHPTPPVRFLLGNECAALMMTNPQEYTYTTNSPQNRPAIL